MRAQELLEYMAPLYPADFFSHSAEIKQKMTALPDLSDLLAEDPFATVSLCWSEEGIKGKVEGKNNLQETEFPKYEKTDAWEFFLDTRNNKENSSPSRFCHHFIIFAKQVHGVQVKEISKCSAEDSHPLCNPKDIQVVIEEKKKGYTCKFFLPKEILHGYDPIQCPKIGFAYRLHRYKADPQHFPLSGKYMEIWQHPALWASLTLT